jgi:hypothetical protein
MQPIIDNNYLLACVMTAKITDFSYTSRTKIANRGNLEMV